MTLDEPIAYYCRICRRALDVFRPNARGLPDSYLHPPKFGRPAPDHEPAPVPLTELADPILECDFCSADGTSWIYTFANFGSSGNEVIARRYVQADYEKHHTAARIRSVVTAPAQARLLGIDWSACEPCAELIEARDILGLVRRVVDGLPPKATRSNRIARVRAEIITIYEAMFPTIRPGRRRVTPEHPLGEPAGG